MATIAKLVAEIGGDPTGLTRALKETSGKISDFVDQASLTFGTIGDGVNLTKWANRQLKELRTVLNDDIGQIRADLARGLITPQDATDAGIAAGVAFNQGILKAINSIEATERPNVGPLRAKLISEYLAVGVDVGKVLAEGIPKGIERSVSPAAANIRRALLPIEEEISSLGGGGRGGGGLGARRQFQLVFAVTTLIEGLDNVESGKTKLQNLSTAITSILRNLSLTAAFMFKPPEGLIIAAVAGGVAAIIDHFAKMSDAAKKAHEDFVKEMSKMIDDVDQLGLQKKLQSILQGVPSAGLSQLGNFFRGGLLDLQARQARDLAALSVLDAKNRREGGLASLGKDWTELHDSLQGFIDARKPQILELQRQADLLRDAILNPPGAGQVGSGQLPAVKVNAKPTADAFTELEKTVRELITLSKQLADAGLPNLDVLQRINGLYSIVEDKLRALDKLDPWSDQALKVRGLAAEMEKVINLQADIGRLPVRVTSTGPLPFQQPISFAPGAGPAGGKGFDQLGQDVALATAEITRFQVAMSVLRDDVGAMRDAALKFAESIGTRVLEQFAQAANPLNSVLDGISRAAAPLQPAFAEIGNVVAAVLAPVFKALAPVIEELTPIVAAILQILAPIVQAFAPLLKVVLDLIRPFLPLLKDVAIVFTFVGQVVATLAGVVLKITSALVNAVGGAIKAIGTIISHIPFLGGIGRDIRDFGQGILNFGNGLNEAGRDMFAASAGFADARKQIQNVDLSDPLAGIKALGDAAQDTANILNAPSGFKVEFVRFLASAPVQIAQPSTAATTSAAQQPATTTVNVDTINIDAKSLSKGQLFDLVAAEAQSRALARFGTTTRAGEAFA